MNTKDAINNWSDIALFLAIARSGNLSAAAEQVGMSQPTLGRRLQALEQRLDATLFVRGGRRLQLTDAGNAILESAERMSREMSAIERAVDVHARGLSGDVTITATEGIGTDWLAPELVEFHRQYPDIVLNIKVENRPLDLVHREADIALRLGRPTQPDLIARRLVDVTFGLYGSRQYLESRGSVECIEDLDNHDFISLILPDDTGHVAFSETSVIPVPFGRTVLSSNSPAAQMSAARAGYGLTVVSCRWASMHKEMVRVLPEVDVHRAELWLVTHEELKHSARIRAVSDAIAERVLARKLMFDTGT
ncbi:MAG: LysR family transcriptional regulator [Xanthomonadales bacterium]|nr:LysR family transcriptional regulator [Xanthomonadales bacterium]